MSSSASEFTTLVKNRGVIGTVKLVYKFALVVCFVLAFTLLGRLDRWCRDYPRLAAVLGAVVWIATVYGLLNIWENLHGIL